MDRILCRTLRHGRFRKFSSNGVKSCYNINTMSTYQRLLLSQLKSIHPQNLHICERCKSIKLLQTHTESFLSLAIRGPPVALFNSSKRFYSESSKHKDDDLQNKKEKESKKEDDPLKDVTFNDLWKKLKDFHSADQEGKEKIIEKTKKEYEDHLKRLEELGKKNKELRENQDKKNEDKKSESKKSEDDEDPEEKMKRDMARMSTFFGLGLLALILANMNSQSQVVETDRYYISWSEFYHNLLLKGEVKKIDLYFLQDDEQIAVIHVHDGAIVKGKTTSRKNYAIKVPQGVNFESKVREVEDEMGMAFNDRVPIHYERSNPWLQAVLQIVLVLAGMAFMRRMIFGKSSSTGSGSMMDSMFGGMRKAKFTRADVTSKTKGNAVTFKEVAGLKEAKVEVMEFITYLTKPDVYKALGAKTPRGALLLGPPGCGKTLLARALATEAGVPFLAMAGSEFVEVVGGVGAARVRDLFKEARQKAPCMVYIDEIDAIGKKRHGSNSQGSGEDEHTLNQLLVEMDGMGTQDGVIMLAATNRADILDKALLRPGRFDRHIMIDLPTMEEREEIFMVYLDKLKLAQPAHVYARPLSRLTPGMSGADINNICNEAAIHAARDKKSFVDKEDFEYSIERIIAGSEKQTSVLGPREKKVVAYHESGHALVGWMLKHTDALLRISIVPRTTSALGFAQYLPSEHFLYSEQELFERICMAMGGRAAESLIFNHVSSGAQDDLKRVTKMAYEQIRSYGMNRRVGHLSFPSDEESGTKPFSQKLGATIDEEARKIVQEAFLHTLKVLEDNKDKLHKLATTLLEKEVLDYDDIEALIGPPVHGKKNTIEPHGWSDFKKTKEVI